MVSYVDVLINRKTPVQAFLLIRITEFYSNPPGRKARGLQRKNWHFSRAGLLPPFNLSQL